MKTVDDVTSSGWDRLTYTAKVKNYPEEICVGKLGSRRERDLGNVPGWDLPTGLKHWDRILTPPQSKIFVNLSFWNVSQANLSKVTLENMSGNQGGLPLHAVRHYPFIVKGEAEALGGCSSPQPTFGA